MGKKTEGRIYRSQWSMIWRRFRKNKLAMAGMVVFILLVLVAIFADIIADYDTMVVRQNMQERFLPPNSQHWFGTDDYGRDIFARIIHGTRISLFVGIVSILISLIIGSVIGATAGYYGGKVDNLLMRIMDVFSHTFYAACYIDSGRPGTGNGQSDDRNVHIAGSEVFAHSALINTHGEGSGIH